MVERLLGCCLFGSVALLLALPLHGNAQQEQVYRGMIFPDLVVVNFFAQLMNHDVEAIRSLFLDDGGVILTKSTESYKSFPVIRDAVKNWLATEKIDLFLQVDKIEVHPYFAIVGGVAKGHLLNLETGLSKQVVYQVESTLRKCGKENQNWCIFALTLTETPLLTEEDDVAGK